MSPQSFRDSRSPGLQDLPHCTDECLATALKYSCYHCLWNKLRHLWKLWVLTSMKQNLSRDTLSNWFFKYFLGEGGDLTLFMTGKKRRPRTEPMYSGGKRRDFPITTGYNSVDCIDFIRSHMSKSQNIWSAKVSIMDASVGVLLLQKGTAPGWSLLGWF